LRRLWRSVVDYIRRTDLYLLSLAVITSSIGLVLIYSATRSYETNQYVYIQAAAIAIGVVVYILTSLIDIESIAVFWKILLIINILFIGSLLIFGVGSESVGNNSWIRFKFLPIGIQPAEIGKLIFIITFSQHCFILRDRINSLRSIILLFVHAAVMVFAVYFCSEDLGMALSYMFVCIIILFATGLKLRWFAIGGALCALAVPVVWNFFLKGYHKDRILVVFDPTIDPDKAYHALQSQIALGAGEITGKGFLQGRQTQFSVLPTKHTDFIFSVAGEEFGFIGCITIILLLALIIIRVFYVAHKYGSDFSSLLCMGVGGMILFQTFVNIGMCLGVSPVIGLTLPFLSYGGTSIVTMFASLGIVAGARIRQKPSWLQ